MLILSVLPACHWALFMSYFCPPDHGRVLQENHSSRLILIRSIPLVTTWGVGCRSSGGVTLHFNQESCIWLYSHRLLCSSNGKESACDAGDQGSIPGLVSFSGEGNGNPLQYSCLENSVDREAWRATVHGITKSQTRLSD